MTGRVKSKGTMSNDLTTLSHEIEEFADKAIVKIELEIKFPFKYLAESLILQLMDTYHDIARAQRKFKETPHYEISQQIMQIKEKLET